MAKYERFLNVENELKAFTPPPSNLATRAVHSGAKASEWSSKAMIAPVHQSCIYELDDIVNHKYYYTRFDNPSRGSLERILAAMDDGNFAISTSAGMSATNTLMTALSSGDHALIGFDCYEATYRLFTNLGAKLGIETDFLPLNDLTKVKAAIKPNTKLVFFEAMTNPTLRIFDIPAVVKTIKSVNKDVVIAIDNAFLTPYYFRPLNFGADIVMYSMSKYYNGHSDVVQGSLVFKDEALYKRYREVAILIGANPAPWECYLVERSIKSLPARMPIHFRNGLILAKFLEQHPAVEKVNYPGLKSDPDHEKAKKLLNGVPGVVTFWLKDSNISKTQKFFDKLEIVTSAGSFGGPESTISCPCVAAAKGIPADMKASAGITESLIRFSVGLEDPLDILLDIDQALNSIL